MKHYATILPPTMNTPTETKTPRTDAAVAKGKLEHGDMWHVELVRESVKLEQELQQLRITFDQNFQQYNVALAAKHEELQQAQRVNDNYEKADRELGQKAESLRLELQQAREELESRKQLWKDAN